MYEKYYFSISRVHTIRPKLVFLQYYQNTALWWLVKKVDQWCLYEVIEDILAFVFNTKRPPSDIWLLRYKQNSFGWFRKNSEYFFFPKTPKTVLRISQQPNIAQRPFCIKNERQDTLYHLI